MCPGLRSDIRGRGEPHYICSRGGPAPSGELVAYGSDTALSGCFPSQILQEDGQAQSGGLAFLPCGRLRGAVQLVNLRGRAMSQGSPPLPLRPLVGGPRPGREECPGEQRRAALLLGEPVWLVLLATPSSLAPRCHGRSGVSRSGTGSVILHPANSCWLASSATMSTPVIALPTANILQTCRSREVELSPSWAGADGRSV